MEAIRWHIIIGRQKSTDISYFRITFVLIVRVFVGLPIEFFVVFFFYRELYEEEKNEKRLGK